LISFNKFIIEFVEFIPRAREFLTKRVYPKRNVVGSQDTIFDSLSIILCIIYAAVIQLLAGVIEGKALSGDW